MTFLLIRVHKNRICYGAVRDGIDGFHAAKRKEGKTFIRVKENSHVE